MTTINKLTINSLQLTVNERKQSKLSIVNCQMSNVRQRGFTLIELLVVLAIIGVLASFIMSNFIGIRQRARDSQRKSDVRQIQSALELYRADVGSYQSTANFPACGNTLSSGGVTYMTKVPCDPLNTTTGYTYTSGGTTYSIIACLENSNDTEIDTVSNVKQNCTGSSTLWRRTFNNP